MAPIVDINRVRIIRDSEVGKGPVVYAMSRDQRADDNWALLYAQSLALTSGQPLAVAVLPLADSQQKTLRQADFALTGLREVEKRLLSLNIPMFVLAGQPERELPKFLRKIGAGCLVTDFSPLKTSRIWKQKTAEQLDIPVYEVDTHNIVPCLKASIKREYAAYTMRPRINKILSHYLVEIPRLLGHPHNWGGEWPVVNWGSLIKKMVVDKSVPPAAHFSSGSSHAFAQLERFLNQRLPQYFDKRNDPNAGVLSDLSPYLHFGQISAQRVALETQRYGDEIKGQEAFLEELIIRRELSDNFCFHNDAYDSFDGFPAWARESLDNHRHDPRPYIYSPEQFEKGETHDELWNAAQIEMVTTGKMHGYMRMYWAKKILEWSLSPESALASAIYLNDKYELDGNDPNGYTGVAWSIGGVHDRPWFEREIFGKVRFMSYGGCQRKFDIKQYAAGVVQSRAEGDR